MAAAFNQNPLRLRLSRHRALHWVWVRGWQLLLIAPFFVPKLGAFAVLQRLGRYFVLLQKPIERPAIECADSCRLRVHQHVPGPFHTMLLI